MQDLEDLQNIINKLETAQDEKTVLKYNHTVWKNINIKNEIFKINNIVERFKISPLSVAAIDFESQIKTLIYAMTLISNGISVFFTNRGMNENQRKRISEICSFYIYDDNSSVKADRMNGKRGEVQKLYSFCLGGVDTEQTIYDEYSRENDYLNISECTVK